MNKIFLLILLSLAPFFLSAQKLTISGKVTGPVPADGIVVELRSANDSSLIKFTLSEVDGKFDFQELKEGAYIIYASYMGYATVNSEQIKLSLNNPQKPVLLNLEASGKTLSELKVSAKRNFAERRIDRVVIHPDVLIGNAGLTALELLEKSPGIRVDAEGNISMKGKQGVMIYLDDKPILLNGNDLANYLRSLPSGSIESIELMSTPPARYDAAGNAGILIIRQKKNVLKGINAGFSISYGQGRYHRTNNSFNLNYRINKLNFFSNLSWNQNHSYQDLRIQRAYYSADGTYQSGFTQTSYLKREFSGANIRLGLDWYITEKSTLSLSYSALENQHFSPISGSGRVLDSLQKEHYHIQISNPSRRNWSNHSINLNYTWQPKPGGLQVSTNLDYSDYTATITQSLSSTNYAPNDTLLNRTLLDSKLPATIDVWAGRIDLTQPLANGKQLDAGIKSSRVSTGNKADFFDVIGGISVPNYEFTNAFTYEETIQAAYFNYQQNGTRFSLQSGLRAEQTWVKGVQDGNPITEGSSFTRGYLNVFPTLFVQYVADSQQNHVFGLNLGRRISRPDYQSMNPFTYPLDRFTYYGGNPLLQPTFSYSLQLSYTWHNLITSNFEYTQVSNLIEETNEQRGNIFYSRPGNFGKNRVVGIDINAQFQASKRWTLIGYAELKNLSYNATIYQQKLSTAGTYLALVTTNQFKLSDVLSSELEASYQSSIVVAQFITIPVFQLRAGMAMKVFKNKGNLKLGIGDLFYSLKNGGEIRSIGYAKASWLSYFDSRVFTISFSYRFSKGQTLGPRKTGASQDEQGRIKTN